MIPDHLKYFKKQDGSLYTKYTKEEIYEKIDVCKPATFISLLEALDIPYFEEIWGITLAHQAKYDRRTSLNTAFGKYLSKMRLVSFKNFTFKDSKYHKELEEFCFSPCGIYYDDKDHIHIIKELENI